MDRKEEFLKPGERLDDLQNGYWMIQNPSLFCYGIDAVLLASYAKVKRGERAMDFCTGSGIVPILLKAKTNGEHFSGLEIQGVQCRGWHSGVCGTIIWKMMLRFSREM